MYNANVIPCGPTTRNSKDCHQMDTFTIFLYITYLNKAVSYQMMISRFYFSVFYYLPAIKNITYISQFDILIVFCFVD